MAGELGLEEVRRLAAAMAGVSPEQRALMLEADLSPERIRQLEAQHGGRQERLAKQMEQARSWAMQPGPAAGPGVPAQVGSILSQVLRGIGGGIMAHQAGKALSADEEALKAAYDMQTEKWKRGKDQMIKTGGQGISDALRAHVFGYPYGREGGA